MTNAERSKAKQKVLDTVIKMWPSSTRDQIAAKLQVSLRTVDKYIARLKSEDRLPAKEARLKGPSAEKANTVAVEGMTEKAKLALLRLSSSACSPIEMGKYLGIPPSESIKVVDELSKTHCVTLHGGLWTLGTPEFGRIAIDYKNGEWRRIGLVADTHLGCEEERLDALHKTYDTFAEEGIKDVFHAGNLVDGYIPKINGSSAIVTTPDAQAQYVVDNYPRRPGITTHFITGDDHEGWWRGLNWGAYCEMVAKRQGRTDLRYLGHMEADIDFRVESGAKIIMKVMHPGGGTSYARSYTSQKQVEAFQGGEKPQILVLGHYHVNNFMWERNIVVCQLPGFQDQTMFARKKRLRMDVGGSILEFKQNPEDGALLRVRYELLPFFDRGYYRRFIASDSRLVKGHMVME